VRKLRKGSEFTASHQANPFWSEEAASKVLSDCSAAKEGEVIGPIFGSEGACLFRRHELRAAQLPGFEQVAPQVVTQYQLEGTAPRTLEAMGKLRERVVAALAKAPDKREAFRKAVEGEPLLLHIPTPVRVILAAPFVPTDAGQMRPSLITGLGPRPEVSRAVFRLRPGQVSGVVGTQVRLDFDSSLPVRESDLASGRPPEGVKPSGNALEGTDPTEFQYPLTGSKG
jgi:hypothetical protein